MEILLRLKALIVFLYITAKWLGLTAWWVTIASMVWAEGYAILLVPAREGALPIGAVFAIFLIVPLLILSIIEWVIFGKLTWSYRSFQQD
jgi:hypothetical protein